MNKYLLFVLILGSTVLLHGCNVINPPETTPTYIHIDSFHFVDANPVATGGSSHNIGTVWVTCNGGSVGVFDIPCTIPIIVTGKANIIFAPGISVDGLQDNQGQYDFYTLDTLNTQAAPGKIINHNPTVQYVTQNIQFLYKENFDVSSGPTKRSTTFSYLSGDDSIHVTTNPDSAYQLGSGRIYLNTVGDSSENISKGFVIPENSPGIIELDYKGSMPFSIGLQATLSGFTAQEYFVGFNPKSQWTHVYINCIDFLSKYQGGTYQICIKAKLTTDVNQPNGFVLLDNLKVITN